MPIAEIAGRHGPKGGPWRHRSRAKSHRARSAGPELKPGGGLPCGWLITLGRTGGSADGASRLRPMASPREKGCVIGRRDPVWAAGSARGRAKAGGSRGAELIEDRLRGIAGVGRQRQANHAGGQLVSDACPGNLLLRLGISGGTKERRVEFFSFGFVARAQSRDAA